MKKTIVFLCVLVLSISCLSVAAAALDAVTVATIDAIPYTSLQAAVDAVKNGTQAGTIVLQQSTTEDIVVSCDIYVDLNGNNIKSVTVTDGAFYGTDSATNDFVSASEEDYGIIDSFTGKMQAAFPPVEDGYGYLMFSNNNTDASFHYVELRVTDMVLHPQNEGEETCNPSLSYKCVFKGDEVVAANVESFGVALSLVDEPAKITLEQCGYSTFTDFVPGANGNTEQSTLLRCIMKESNANLINKRNANLPVYGSAYLKLKNDGEYIFGNCQARSFKEQVELFDENWTDYTEENHADAIMMYKKYRKLLKSWDLTNTYDHFMGEEDKVLRILNISNSHGQDSVWQLPTVFNAERPDLTYMVAECYFSGALREHVANAKKDAPEYVYWTKTNTDELWNETRDVPISYALEQEHWDIVMFNESSRHLGLETYMSRGYVDWFRSYILRNLCYEPTLYYNMTWSNPTDDRFHDPNLSDRRKALEGFKDTYTKDYGYDHVNHYNCLVSLTEKYLVNHEGFDKIIWNATPIQYAQTEYGVPQWDDEQVMDLYRDYTHLSDFARLMVAYQFYAQLFGVDEITDVNVDVIPQALRATTWQQKLGALTITEEHKQIIMDCVNHTLKHPLTVED
jgi:hypothetical protein